MIPESEYSSLGLIKKIDDDNYDIGRTLLLKGIGGKKTIEEYLINKEIDYKKCDVYERILNKDNLAKVSQMINQGCIIIGFSKSSVEPLIRNPDVNLENVHFFFLDKSDEMIIINEDVASITKIEEIYDIETLALKINQINE